MKTTPLQEQLNAAGKPGDTSRLKLIASLNLGEQSEAAKRVLIKRSLKAGSLQWQQ